MPLQLLIPVAVSKLNATTPFAGLFDGTDPRPGYFFVRIFFGYVVLCRIPLRQIVDDLGDAIEIVEARGRLWLIRREKVGGEVAQGVDDVLEVLLYTIKGVIRSGIRPEGEGRSERRLIIP